MPEKLTMKSVNEDLQKYKENHENLEKNVQDIYDIIHFDGGLVYQCDMKSFGELNTLQHEDILKQVFGRMDKLETKLDTIFPVVEKEIKKSEAWNIILKDNDNKIRSGKFWIQILLAFSVVVGVIIAVIEGLSKVVSYFK